MKLYRCSLLSFISSESGGILSAELGCKEEFVQGNQSAGTQKDLNRRPFLSVWTTRYSVLPSDTEVFWFSIVYLRL
jgi:hypothetical protein